MEEFISRFWAPLGAVLGLVVWSVRLEAKVSGNEKEVRRVWRQRDEDQNSAKDTRNETSLALQTIQAQSHAQAITLGKIEQNLISIERALSGEST